MRKIIVFILVLMILSTLSLTAAAAQEKLTMSDASAQAGNTVFLTVTLNESVSGDTIGLTYTYDADLLQAIPGSCSWDKKGVLEDFNNKNSGAWAASTSEDLQGDICTLAFRILPGADFTGTKVSCTLIVKKDSKKIGEFKAQALVTLGCDHNDIGSWEDQGMSGHSRTCNVCKAVQTQSHKWDVGKIVQNTENPGTQLKIFTCTVCGGTNAVEITGGQLEPTVPEETRPPETEPTYMTAPSTMPQPETRPVFTEPEPQDTQAQDATVPTHSHQEESTAPPYVDYNEGTQANSPEETTHPMYTPITGEDAGHDHIHTIGQTQDTRGATAAVMIVTAAVIIGVAVYVVKKKR